MNCSPTSAHGAPACSSQTAPACDAAQWSSLLGNLTPPHGYGAAYSDEAFEKALCLGDAGPDLDLGLGDASKCGARRRAGSSDVNEAFLGLEEGELRDLFSSTTPVAPMSVPMDDGPEAVGEGVDMGGAAWRFDQGGDCPLLPSTAGKVKVEEPEVATDGAPAGVMRLEETGMGNHNALASSLPFCAEVESTGLTAAKQEQPSSPLYLPSPPPMQMQQEQQEKKQKNKREARRGVSRRASGRSAVQTTRRTGSAVRCNNKRALDARWPEQLLATNAYNEEVRPFLATLSKQDQDAFKRARRRYRNRACAERKKRANPERGLTVSQLQQQRHQLEWDLTQEEARVRTLQSIAATLEGALAQSSDGQCH